MPTTWLMISFWDRLADLISPRACSSCGNRMVMGEDIICASCNLHLPRTGYADDPLDNEMARYFWHRIPIQRCAALFFYKAGAPPSRIIYNLKYNNRLDIAEMMGQMVAKEFQPKGFFDGIDLIVPIPLARKRQRQRGYNQSEEIARGVSEATGIPYDCKAVRRKSFIDSQTHKDRWERADNVEDAFELLDAARIHGKHILVIDDVVTTGATICACGKQLAMAGDVKISVLSLAFAKS